MWKPSSATFASAPSQSSKCLLDGVLSGDTFEDFFFFLFLWSRGLARDIMLTLGVKLVLGVDGVGLEGSLPGKPRLPWVLRVLLLGELLGETPAIANSVFIGFVKICFSSYQIFCDVGISIPRYQPQRCSALLADGRTWF
jgi:hypothetical protein